MHQIYPDQGLLYLLGRMANGGGSGLFWRLFTSNTSPGLASVLGDFTLAAAGWGRIQVSLASFTLQQVAAHVGSIQAPNIVFTNNTGGAIVVYGFCIIDPGETLLLGAARFDGAPITVANNGTQTVTPIIGDFSEQSS